jgi:hypothetical protein
VQEPGYDGEVILHEFTHALERFLLPAITQVDRRTRRMTRGLDEGLAFYFPCSFTGQPRWADFAYGSPAWEAACDLSTDPGPPDALAALAVPPVDIYHSLGFWWGRVFLRLETAPGLNAGRINQLALQALSALGGPIAGIEVFAAALYNHALASEKAGIRGVFVQLGIPMP